MHWPRRPIPVPVHIAIIASDWATVSRWLRDEEATQALGHPPLLATPGTFDQLPTPLGQTMRAQKM